MTESLYPDLRGWRLKNERHNLVGSQCSNGHVSFPKREVCISCGEDDGDARDLRILDWINYEQRILLGEKIQELVEEKIKREWQEIRQKRGYAIIDL